MANQGGGPGTGVVIFVAGILLGVAIGVLVAPRSGRETREILAGKAGELREKALDVADEVRYQAEEAVEKARAAAVDVTRKAQEKLEGV
jgi:gas vesicle protein